MSNSIPLIFEEAVKEAQSFVGHEDKLQGLVNEASQIAEQHSEFLLSAWETLQIFIRLVRSWLTGKYCVPFVSLLMIVASLIYLVNPFDLIPDSIPVLGFVDDAAVITFVARANLQAISRFRKWETSMQ
jgi:uncharacterized membrane protein YkvA (DUF1232 family)